MPDILYLEDLVDEYETELALPEDERDPILIEDIEDLMSEIGASDLDSFKHIARDDAGLISDFYFETYAQDLAESIGAIDTNVGWPLYHIDWDAAARTLKMDYLAVDYGGTTYWMGG